MVVLFFVKLWELDRGNFSLKQKMTSYKLYNIHFSKQSLCYLQNSMNPHPQGYFYYPKDVLYYLLHDHFNYQKKLNPVSFLLFHDLRRSPNFHSSPLNCSCSNHLQRTEPVMNLNLFSTLFDLQTQFLKSMVNSTFKHHYRYMKATHY